MQYLSSSFIALTTFIAAAITELLVFNIPGPHSNIFDQLGSVCELLSQICRAAEVHFGQMRQKHRFFLSFAGG